jgi:hypothetical protein
VERQGAGAVGAVEHAELSFLPGPDAVALLSLRVLRTTSLALISWGAAIATAFAGYDHLTDRIATPSALLGSLLTPFAVLALGVILRVLVAPLAYFVSLVFIGVSSLDITSVNDRRGWWGKMTDRIRLAGAYRSLRWTNAVKDEAVASLGRPGMVFKGVEQVTSVLVYVGWAAFLVAALGET